ncbi:hypothetical protein [Hymenobacter cellulosivorans]|uniref:Uncharacterized protein n=1 Tax=Hymenobacter cellulosivorans TaxID=2932249 RepID=A0ABY4F429_9BACT|nr:hypothetical protein [Hymenobacter cellulosivorans]UOQ50822.1 hypothetical protein MUN80_13750 [Hymenobacter cellulosivorans]
MTKSDKVQRVESISLVIEKKLPPILVIQATGTVPTLGYTNVHLEPYIYITPPADGFYEFTFRATAPDGPAGEVVTTVEATFPWEDYPQATLRGVRIYAEQNEREEKL